VEERYVFRTAFTPLSHDTFAVDYLVALFVDTWSQIKVKIVQK